LSSHLAGIVTAIHEQNSLVGSANRLLFAFVDRIYLSYPLTLNAIGSRKARLVGNPVRVGFSQPKSGSSGTFTVMVQGGSHGAPALNSLVLDSLPYLRDEKSLHFIHQTGRDDQTRVRLAYQSHAVSAEVEDFIPNPAAHLARANLVISRAGASAIAELTLSGSPALLVPLPFVDNHQVSNARPLARIGAAELLLQNSICGATLANRILFYRAHPEKLATMRERMLSLSYPHAAKSIVDDLYSLYHRLKSKESSVTISQ